MGIWDAYVQIIENDVPKTDHLESGSMNYIDFEYISRKAHEISNLGYMINTLNYTQTDKAYMCINLHQDPKIMGRLIIEYTEVDTYSKRRQMLQPRLWLFGLAGEALDIINEHIKVLSFSDSRSMHNILVTKYLNGLHYSCKVDGKMFSTTMLPEETSEFFVWKDVYCGKLSKNNAKEITRYLKTRDKSLVSKEVVKKFLTALFLNYVM